MSRAKTGWRQAIKSANDLRTPQEKTRAKFLELALERTRRADPLVEEGRHLRALAADAKAPAQLWEISEIRAALLTASGLSDKAKNHITAKDQKKAFLQMSREVLEPKGAGFVDELVYRFLLTRGDTLGGMMRNVGGKLAKRKLVNRLCAAVKLRGAKMLAEPAAVAEQTRFLAWESPSGKQTRTLALDITIPQTRSNVDAVLLSCKPSDRQKALQSKANFLALGELKGGIDPAGADEHWKTANSALERLRHAFAKTRPQLFFIGAAIEERMAKEIYAQLQNGDLNFAANLTSERQLSAACKWLTSL